jgi:hypothetical protein
MNWFAALYSERFRKTRKQANQGLRFTNCSFEAPQASPVL